MNNVTLTSSTLSIVTGQNPFSNRFAILTKLLKQHKIIGNKPINYPIQKDTKSIQNCTLGIKNESQILNEWCNSNNINAKKPDLKKKKLFDLNNSWILSGIPDALTDTNELVEIKHRSKYVFDQIPIYDFIQIQSYLQLYDMKICHYIQYYDGNLYSEKIYRDDSYWILHILPKILEFATLYEKISEDSDELEKIMYFNSLK